MSAFYVGYTVLIARGESATMNRVHSPACALLWVLLVISALKYHLCLSQLRIHELQTPASNGIISMTSSGDVLPGDESSASKAVTLNPYFYHYVHNETRIAMAREKAQAVDSSSPSSRTSAFLGFNASQDACTWAVTAQDLSYQSWLDTSTSGGLYEISVLAVESCATRNYVSINYEQFEISSEPWVVAPKPSLVKDDLHSFRVFVSIKFQSWNILADGVYEPGAGRMHLVGCARDAKVRQYHGSTLRSPGPISPTELPQYQSSVDAINLSNLSAAYLVRSAYIRSPPVNESLEVHCGISATVQYPPLHPFWNTERVMKLELRSSRVQNDPLYFEPIVRTVFFTYTSPLIASVMEPQRRLETAGRVVALLLGLVCIVLQIEHGRHNEDALPYVSLAMLSVQLANHLAQTSVFKDLEIPEFHRSWGGRNGTHIGSSEWYSSFSYYGRMAWSQHVPYQAMAMAAIFMYVWIFHKVGDRRRIMKLRVLRKRPGAKDAPSEWLVVYTSAAIFWYVAFVGFVEVDDADTSFGYIGDRSPFLSLTIYRIIQEQWMHINRLTGLVVSFFLVPQVLGGWYWNAQGYCPLSVWFYGGITLLQSLPHIFSIVKHFQLLPIFAFYDPYLDLTFGNYHESTPWWRIGVVLCSALLALCVYFQAQFKVEHRGLPK